MTSAIWWGIFGFGLVVLLGRRVWLRIQLSRAKHRSLAGHARMGAAAGATGALLRVRRGAVFPRRRRPGAHRRAATRGFSAA